MTPYVCKFLPKEDIEVFNKIQLALSKLPDVYLGCDLDYKHILLSCHHLSRAVSEVFGHKVVDGKFCVQYSHSWILTKSENIIDVYPIGVFGGPVLIDGNIRSPIAHLYKEESLPIDFECYHFKTIVKTIAKLLK